MMTRNQWMAVSVIVLLVLDIVSRYSHPAYNYYRDYCADLDNRFADFKHSVVSQFLPSVNGLFSNLVSNVSTPVSSSVSVSSSDPAHVTSSQISISGFFHRSQGRSMVCYNGFDFQVGDTFLGSEIMSLDPSAIVTRTTVYRLNPEKRSNSCHHPPSTSPQL